MFRSPRAPLGLASAFLLVAAGLGCGDHPEARFRFGDCNDRGCFGCTDETKEACWPLPYPPCLDQKACAAGQICTNIGCATACAADGDCRQGEVCTAGGYCAPGNARTWPVEPGQVQHCLVDGECMGGYACVGGTCSHPASCGLPVLCTSDAQCGTGRAGRDRAGPAACPAAACPVGQACKSGFCADAAPSPAQCLFDAACGPAARCINATCHPLCAIDSQCAAHEFCDAGVCRADVRAAASVPRT